MRPVEPLITNATKNATIREAYDSTPQMDPGAVELHSGVLAWQCLWPPMRNSLRVFG